MIRRAFRWLFVIVCSVAFLPLIALAAPEDFAEDEFADEWDNDNLIEVLSEDPIEAIPDTDLSMDITIDDSVSGSAIISQLITQLGESRVPVVSGDQYELVGVELRSLNPIQPSGSGSLKDTLLSFIGDYDAVVVEYQYQNQQGTYQYLREIQPDYAWMISAAVLIVFVYCLFRLGGAILCRR